MSEARQGGYELVTTPCLWFSRGEPLGQAAGHPFFGSFLWSEQRNEHKRKVLSFVVNRIVCSLFWQRVQRANNGLFNFNNYKNACPGGKRHEPVRGSHGA